MKKYLLSLLAVAAIFFNGCEDRSDISLPSAPAVAVNTGSASFTSFVSLGNSITAGYQSSSLFKSAQDYSFGKMIAKQVGTSYEVPFVTDPGIGGKINLVKLDLTTVPSTPYLAYSPVMGGAPTNSALAKPYNNLGVPGAILLDLVSTDAAFVTSRWTSNPYFSVVLRSTTTLGINEYEQAKKLNPTFMTVWIGNNDVLGYATSGGTSGTDATGKLPTDAAVFTSLYGALTAKISAEMPNTKVAFANIPDVSAIPFFTTVGPSVYLSLSKAGAPGLVCQVSNSAATGGIKLVALSDLATLKVMLTLKASTYAALIGRPTGKFYKDFNYPALPAGVDTTKPFGLDAANPFPNALVLDDNEQAIVSAAVSSFNTTIANAISGKANFVLVDVNSVFKTIRANDSKGGTNYDGLIFKTNFISGFMFSLDGVHPSNQGHAIIANEFIKAINSKFGATIPLVNVAATPSGLSVGKQLPLNELGLPQFPARFFENLYF